MRAYLEITKKSFLNNLVFRVEYFAGLANSIVTIFVNIAIWRAVYDEEGTMDQLQFSMIVTYVILAMALFHVFSMDEYIIEKKIKTGLIASDLLRPLSFRLQIFSYHLGALIYKLILLFVPTLLFYSAIYHILPPFSTEMFFCFLFSIVLGYLVMYHLNFLIWISAFWLYKTFSLVTIKDTMVMVLSGAVIPLWYMPAWLVSYIKLTPFDTIFYVPISIYLGQLPEHEILTSILRQAGWVLALTLACHLLWKRASKRIVVQGG
ncbi:MULTISPECIES: ABC transporter permease [Paenibacillus]|uniref:ABC transporter permease n=1 Tax=Paenibacillus borealis TaxID=160799 RepID=A0ABX3H0E0_PAEBO|nr:ABC-2 family transporter protein [Paenibacillus borealis]OMD42364.1 ABC transporter permease [Paenibacillus borealis]